MYIYECMYVYMYIKIFNRALPPPFCTQDQDEEDVDGLNLGVNP